MSDAQNGLKEMKSEMDEEQAERLLGRRLAAFHDLSEEFGKQLQLGVLLMQHGGVGLTKVREVNNATIAKLSDAYLRFADEAVVALESYLNRMRK